jgi:hypothetical protein
MRSCEDVDVNLKGKWSLSLSDLHGVEWMDLVLCLMIGWVILARRWWKWSLSI